MSEAPHRWGTAEFPAADRHSAWEDMLKRAYGSWKLADPPAASMDAQVTSRAIGPMQIVDCICDPCGASRSRADIGRDPGQTVTIQLVLSGREHFTIDDHRHELSAGDVLIWHSLKPMNFEVTERLRKISVTMPLTRLRSWLPGRWLSIGGKLPNSTPGAALLSSAVTSMSTVLYGEAALNGEALTESMTTLLVGMFDHGASCEPRTLRQTQRALVKTYIADNLADPALTPDRIALGRHMSVRYLHSLFEAEALTVQQYIIRERLLRCHRDLACTGMNHRTITDIAFSWGFQNATHFSRRFKAEFGITPHEFRAANAAA